MTLVEVVGAGQAETVSFGKHILPFGNLRLEFHCRSQRHKRTWHENDYFRSLSGERLHAGQHQFRAFPTTVTGGTLTLRFSGSSVGPLYYNSIQWMVSAVILQRSGQPLLPESSLALAEAAARSTGWCNS